MRDRTVRLHPSVAGFDRAAATYERARPGYPDAAIRFLGRTLRLGTGTTVVDLASGTGKFTRALRPLHAAVVAVEPTRGMRRVFARSVPDVPVIDGTAEAIPLPDGFADAVVCAQAFHWFRAGPAIREIARVVRPRGGLAHVWNRRDESVPWVREFSRITDRGRHGTPRTRDEGWRMAFSVPGSPWVPIRRATFRHAQVGTPALFVERALSISFVAASPPAERGRVAAEIRALLASDPTTRGRTRIELPYVTEVYWTRRRR